MEIGKSFFERKWEKLAYGNILALKFSLKVNGREGYNGPNFVK